MIATTHNRPFCVPEDKPLFSVNAKVPISDALEQAIILLGCVTRLLMTDSLDHDQGRNNAQYLLEMANALVEACLAGVWEAPKAG